MKLNEVSEKDIEAMKQRLQRRQERRQLDRDVEEVINMVHKRREYCADCGVMAERRFKCYT